MSHIMEKSNLKHISNVVFPKDLYWVRYFLYIYINDLSNVCNDMMSLLFIVEVMLTGYSKKSMLT